MKEKIRSIRIPFILLLACLIFVTSCKGRKEPNDDVQEQYYKSLLNYMIIVTESVLNLTDVSIVFEDNEGNVETEFLTLDNVQEHYVNMYEYIKEYRFNDFPASFNCKVNCTPKTDIDPYEFCTQNEDGEWIINDIWGLGLEYVYLVDSVLVDLGGGHYYPTGKKLEDLDDLCEDIDGDFLNIYLDENGEIVVNQ